jgi:methylenetetrahydrofolate reductase (NADPH)
MASPGDFRYAAELVAFIRERTGDHFQIEVAAYPETHPQAENALRDLQNFKAKIDAGADGAITQYFFNADAYFRFVEDVARLGVTVPIVPGIMPISSYSQLQRFSDLCGAEIPRWIAKRMQALGDDVEGVRQLGAEVVARLCQRLLDGGAPGLHIYTLNRAKAPRAVLEQLL